MESKYRLVHNYAFITYHGSRSYSTKECVSLGVVSLSNENVLTYRLFKSDVIEPRLFVMFGKDAILNYVTLLESVTDQVQERINANATMEENRDWFLRFMGYEHTHTGVNIGTIITSLVPEDCIETALYNIEKGVYNR
jgi:hypothetical protein